MQEGGCKIPGLSWKNRIPIDKSITFLTENFPGDLN